MAAKTAMQMPNLQMPTGYEEQQRKIALRRKLAQMMFEQGMGGDRARTPWDALAKIAQTGAGVLHEKRATKKEGQLGEQIKADFNTKRQALLADVQAGVPPQQLMAKYGADPMLGGELEPFRDAYASGLKNREDLVQSGMGFTSKGDVMSGRAQLQSKPTDKVLSVGDQWMANPVAVSADLASNPLPPGAEVTGLTNSMPNPYANQQPPVSPSGAVGAGPSAGSQPAGGLDLSRLSPEEKQILQNELARRAGGGASIPSGNPLDPGLASKPPMGMPGVAPPKTIGGKQYWNINGKWYDNPEGR